MKNRFKIALTYTFILLVIPFRFIYAQHLIKVEQGFNMKFFTQDPININVSNQDYSLRSNQAFSYEFGYILKSSNKIFVESGLKFGSYSNSFTVNIIDPSNNFNESYTFRNLDLFYAKLPFYIGYHFKIENLAFQLKAGLNFIAISNGAYSAGFTATNSTNVIIDYLDSKIQTNPSNNLIRSKTISLGYAHSVFKKSVFLTELTLDFYKQYFGDTYFEVYPNDSRVKYHKGVLHDRQNVSLDFSLMF